MLGIIPAAGVGSRIQPLAFSKELLPVGTRSEDGEERPRAVSEYLVERLVLAGATRLCFVISPGKSDIMAYYGGSVAGVPICYAIQDAPRGLCDALFCALPFMAPEETVAVGLPDTIWFPRTGLTALPDDELSFLLFPVTKPQLFDAVVTDADGSVREIQVKQNAPTSSWIWGAFKSPGRVFGELHDLWQQRDRRDPYLGTLVNAYLARGGHAVGKKSGLAYVDVGTLHGFREAFALLERTGPSGPEPTTPPRQEWTHAAHR